MSDSFPLPLPISDPAYLFQECEYEISQKGELVARLENKTREISQMLSNLNKITGPGGKGTTEEKRSEEAADQERCAEPETSAKQSEK